MMMSIIVPVYNVELYLDQCVFSIVNQTYKDLEIILVDDGSTDNSGLKCDEWSKKDSRIKVFHKQNGGLMSAWKYGVLQATGEYIGFVDSDDWIDLDMYEKLIERVADCSADLAICGFVHERAHNSIPDYCSLSEEIYDNEAIQKEIYPILIRNGNYYARGISPNRVTKLFRKNLLLEVLDYCDERVSIGEDLLTTFAVMSKVNILATVSDFCPYHYREDNISMIRSFSDVKYEKLELLKTALEKVDNELYEYDFCGQINADYITLTLQLMEQEILLSDKKSRALRKSIKNRIKSPAFREAIQVMDKSKLSRKAKWYLFLIKFRLIGILILVRKLKR